MSKIRIKNFGPIKTGCLDNEGWMDIKKVTVFIGNQGSGKSTVAKVYSTLTWLEKALNRGDVEKGEISHDFFYEIFSYQRIKNYFRDNTEIEYEGDTIKVVYKKSLNYPEIIQQTINHYSVPKIMYVPSERNFLSVIRNAFGIKNLPDTLYTFAEELRKGQLALNDELLHLPIDDLKYKFTKENETSYLIGDDFELDLLESSSGFQSLVPMYLVTKFLSDELQKGTNVLREQLNVEQSVRRNKEIADVMFDKDLSDKEKSEKIIEIDSKYLNTCIINIVEEPEQNLFPTSQWELVKTLLEFNNLNSGSKLLMTTHSPYLISYLTLAVEANALKEKICTDELKARLNQIVPLGATINGDDLAIYELEEQRGTIRRLGNYKGLPSDENELNQNLAYTNDLFSQLLEIEDLCQ